MRFIDQFADCMNETVRFYTVASRNAYGEPTHSTYREAKAYIVDRTEEVRVSESEVAVATTRIYAATTAPMVGPIEKVVMPDGTTRASIVSVDRYHDETGPQFCVVKLGAHARLGA